MANEMCPSCDEIRETKSSASIQKVMQPNGEEKEVATISYSCTTCNLFASRVEEAE